MNPANRRDFLLTGSAVFASAALAGAAPPTVHVGGDETIKVALVGCGARGTGAAAQALSTKGPVKLWAVADAFKDRLESCLGTLKRGVKASYDREASDGFSDRIEVPIERQFIGLDAYRHAIDSGVDVVLLAEPPGFRPKHFEYAVRAGKHVFMEKPVATDAPGVRRVLAAAAEAKQADLKVAVGLQRHHQGTYAEAIKRIHDGELGDLVTLRAYWNGGLPAKTPVPRAGMSELEYQVRNWYFFTWLSGDHICEQHVHNLDVGNWVKQSHPLEARGMGGRQVRVGKEYGDIFDHHAVEFTYEDDIKLFSQCQQIPGCASRVAEFVRGSKGKAELGGKTSFTLANREEKRLKGDAGSPYQAEQDAFFSAIRQNRAHNEAEYGALSTMTAILGRSATYSGKVVTWEEAFNSQRILTTDAEHWEANAPVTAEKDGSYAFAVPGVTSVI